MRGVGNLYLRQSVVAAWGQASPRQQSMPAPASQDHDLCAASARKWPLPPSTFHRLQPYRILLRRVPCRAIFWPQVHAHFSESSLVVAQQRRRTLRWLSRRFVHGFLRLSDISSASLRRRDVYQAMARATADGDPLLPLVLMLPTHSSAACKLSHPYSDTSAQCCPRRPSRYLH